MADAIFQESEPLRLPRLTFSADMQWEVDTKSIFRSQSYVMRDTFFPPESIFVHGYNVAVIYDPVSLLFTLNSKIR